MNEPFENGGTVHQIDCLECGAKAVTVEHFRQCTGPPDYGRCPGCRGKWPMYRGIYDRHGDTLRCHGCLRIPQECTCW